MSSVSTFPNFPTFGSSRLNTGRVFLPVVIVQVVVIVLAMCSNNVLVLAVEKPAVPTLLLNANQNPYYWAPPSDTAGRNETLINLGVDSDYYFASDTRYATIICNSSYPITWKFHNTEQSGHASWMINIRLKRSASKLYDTSTYTYRAELSLYGDYNRLTGKYSCLSSTNPNLSNSVYIFWEGTSPPYLLQAGENRTVCVYDKDTTNAMVQLPCGVSRANIHANLQKETADKGLQDLSLNHSIAYNSKTGFTLQSLPDLLGNYKCKVQPIPYDRQKPYYLPEDEVNIKVEKCNDTLVDYRKSNATITYDATRTEFTCCSSSSRAPKLFHFYCHHPIMCTFRQDLDSSMLLQFFSRKRSRKGCSKYKVYIHSPGVIRCIGDGIDRTIEYTFPSMVEYYHYGTNTSHIPIYLSWNEIPPSEMIMVLTEFNVHGRPSGGDTEPPPTIYEYQWVQFYCRISPYYFSEGILWAVNFKNSTTQLVKDTRNENPGYGYGYYEYYFNPMLIQIHYDMESVMCIAPIWNTTEYVHKALPLYVNKSIAPELVELEVTETVTWTLNDTNKELKCAAVGRPIPTIAWSHSDLYNPPAFLHAENTSYIDDARDNGTTETYINSETLHIPRVSYTTKGIYNCTATNYGGTVFRTIQVDVEEPPSWKTILGIIIGVLLVALLTVGVLFLAWRMYFEKKRAGFQSSSTITYDQQNGVTTGSSNGSSGKIVARRESITRIANGNRRLSTAGDIVNGIDTNHAEVIARSAAAAAAAAAATSASSWGNGNNGLRNGVEQNDRHFYGNIDEADDEIPISNNLVH